MRTVKLEAQVPDSSGLFFDLVKAGFEVVGVSSEKGTTCIHLEGEEDKDPLPVADLWIGKTADRPSRSTREERRKLYEKHIAEKSSRMAALRSRIQAQNEVSAYSPELSLDGQAADGPFQMMTLEAPKKKSLLKRLLELL